LRQQVRRAKPTQSYEALTKELTAENAVPGNRHYAQKYNSKGSENCVDRPIAEYVSAN
jgi:hypothetical protein